MGRKRYSMADYHREAISKAMIGKNIGKEPWNKGLEMEEEQKEKISKANRGKHRSKKVRAKMSEAHKGKKFSEETKAKMAEKRREYWAKKRAEKTLEAEKD